MITKIERRIKIKYRVRNKISGTAERPRMSVFRSNKQIYVQVIDDDAQKTLVAASSLGLEKMNKSEQAEKVGEMVEFGGLLGYAPVMPVNPFSCDAFVNRGGRIPAPIHSFKN